jgi:hypothetical protein
VFPCSVGPANIVFGQRNDFHAGGCNFGATVEGASADSLCVPEGIAVDSHDNLYIADQQNNRVLEFNTPLTVTPVFYTAIRRLTDYQPGHAETSLRSVPAHVVGGDRRSVGGAHR